MFSPSDFTYDKKQLNNELQPIDKKGLKPRPLIKNSFIHYYPLLIYHKPGIPRQCTIKMPLIDKFKVKSNYYNLIIILRCNTKYD